MILVSRPPVAKAPELDGKSILITGATGSFGKQFVRTVLNRFKPRRLIVFSRDERKQSEMANWLLPEVYPCLRFFWATLEIEIASGLAFRDVEIVIHAASLKQIPAAEYNPFECIHTSVLGAENVVQAAIASGVKKVLALSTDKVLTRSVCTEPASLQRTKFCSSQSFERRERRTFQCGALW